MKIEVEIASDHIVVESLIEDLRFNHEEISRLNAIGQLSEAQIEDLLLCKDVIAACKVLLSYYMTHDQYHDLIESGKYLNGNKEFSSDDSATESADLGYPRS